MEYKKIHAIFFSATGTTRKIIDTIARGCDVNEIERHDLLLKKQNDTYIPENEIAIFGMPVYAGRIPAISAESLRHFTGKHTPAIIACTYGNRAYDDALLELRNIVEEQGFIVVSAGAFIAQHSIFPHVGTGRPDIRDIAEATEFGRKSISILSASEWREEKQLSLPGNNPYREAGNIPLKPKTRRSCTRCGLCAQQCPAQAIDAENPHRLDESRCISCAHCIAICPRHAKHFGGILYRLRPANSQKNFPSRSTTKFFTKSRLSPQKNKR
jgi:ferredoxin